MNERKRLIDVLNKTFAEQYEKRGLLTALHTADHLLANGVIVPPVSVGDTVYYIDGGYYRKPQNCKVSRPCKVVEVSFKLRRTNVTVMRGFITDNGTRYSFDGVGKTVFLTKEEAEKALAERGKQ